MKSTSDFIEAVQNASTNIRDARRIVPSYEEPVYWGPAASLESQSIAQQNVHMPMQGVKTAAVTHRLAYMTEEEIIKEAAVMGAVARGIGAAAKGVGKALGWGAKTTGKGVAAGARAVNNAGKSSRQYFRATRLADQTAKPTTAGGKAMQAFDVVDVPLTAGALAAPGFAYGANRYSRMGAGGGYG